MENLAPASSPYQQALKFLDQRVDFERFQIMPGGQREFKLDRMQALLERLDNPQNKLSIIHVAGTKGKGSTSAMIAAMLTAAGYRTGLFTSPHLEQVEERISLDGQPCTADEFAELVALVRPAVETLDREECEKGTGPFCAKHPSGRSGKRVLSPFHEGPTYFEILTAMALLYFLHREAPAVVLEVGLGGRLDSTNVCRPLVSVITSISFDHTRQLGDTLAAIAREKAGIIKPGVPVISGVTDAEPREVIQQIARDNHCQLLELNKDFQFSYHPPRHLEEKTAVGSLTLGVTYRDLPLALLGRHQAANAAIALATISELNRQGWNISEHAIREGLSTVHWPARIEIVSRRPVLILDSAHNPASIAALMEVIKESFTVPRRLLLFATTRDKDYPEMIKLLLEKGDRPLLSERPAGCFAQKGPVPFFDEIVFTQYTINPRALPPTELEAEAFRQTGRHYPLLDKPQEAWQYLKRLARPEDLICITGSFFFAGEMRKLL